MRKITNFARQSWLLLARASKSIFKHSQNWYHLTISIATVVAGAWVFYVFVIERNTQAHLALDLRVTISTNSPSFTDRRLVFLDVVLTNVGKRKLEASRAKPAYQDPAETLDYSCGVEMRKIQTPLTETNKLLEWFEETNQLQCPVGIPDEINMLEEYEVPDTPDLATTTWTPNFWIEPSEQYHLGTALILPKGDYLARVHFIGTHGKEDYWSRIVFVQIY